MPERIAAAERFPHQPGAVPEELKADSAWLLCDESKVPLIATRSGACYAASSTDPETWRSYIDAFAAWHDNEWSFAGIGRVIRAEEDYVGVDLDECIDPVTAKLSPWAARILERLNSYSEVSPSGNGVKVWVKAPSITRAHVKPGLEIYPRSRYFTVTGDVVHGSEIAISDEESLIRDEEIAIRDEEIAAIIAEEFPRVSCDRRPYDGPRRVLDVLEYLERSGIEMFAERSDGSAERVYTVRCPWWGEHTDGDVSGTRVGQYASGGLFFCCEHSHCRGVREWPQFRAELDPIVYLGRKRRAKGRLR
jgi:hypothetical protein